MNQRFDASTVLAAFLVLQGILDLAVADDALKKNPAKSQIVQVPKRQGSNIVAWADDRVLSVIEAIPEQFRLLPLIGAACGLREGELFGLAKGDIDFNEMVIRVRRQIKNISGTYVFALPKSDRERIVPMGEWAAEAIRLHLKEYPPTPCSLPWEKPIGKPKEHKILFRWATGGHVKSDLFRLLVWKPALVEVGIIPVPTKGPRGRLKYATTRKEGTHQLRHFYASVTLADGVSIKELAEYLGHKDPGFTLRTYAHMLPSSHERARTAIDTRMKGHSAGTDGAETERGPS